MNLKEIYEYAKANGIEIRFVFKNDGVKIKAVKGNKCCEYWYNNVAIEYEITEPIRYILDTLLKEINGLVEE